MKIIRGIHNVRKKNTNSAITIGNFDGIHLGHQKLFHTLYKIGKKYNVSTIIIFFEPQPLEFLKNRDAPARITTFKEKIKYMSSYNIDEILCIRFNKHFQSLSPQDFIINILIKKLQIKFLIVGEDFKFGYQKNGNINILRKLGKKYDFNLVVIKKLYQNNMKISSTNIRNELFQNNIKSASSLLGRPFSIFGKVIHGNKIGKSLGYPTANIALKKNFLLKNGVYIVHVHYLNKKFLGISNIGIKPSFINYSKNKTLEVHLFDVSINLYLKKIEVVIWKKIRNEQMFDSKEKLKIQISQDIKVAKKYFQINKNQY